MKKIIFKISNWNNSFTKLIQEMSNFVKQNTFGKKIQLLQLLQVVLNLLGIPAFI